MRARNLVRTGKSCTFAPDYEHKKPKTEQKIN
jgi:hypothetical protein